MSSTSPPLQPVELHVSLWARPGCEAQLTAYENAVLALLGDHGATLISRVVPCGGQAAGLPNEIHTIRFASQAGLDSYLVDPRRAALSEQRDVAIARTEVIRVQSLS